MTNLECVMACLAFHREARAWDDHAVATDLLAQLNLKPDGNAAKARPAVMPGISEDEVVAAEAVAKEAVMKAEVKRAEFKAQSAGAMKAMADDRQTAYARERAQSSLKPAQPADDASG